MTNLFQDYIYTKNNVTKNVFLQSQYVFFYVFNKSKYKSIQKT